MQIGLGNSGGLVASNIYLDSQKPTYPLGFGLSLGLIWVCALACTAFFLVCRAENKKREAGLRDRVLQNVSAEEAKNLGDDHPSFRFTY